jgi:N-acetylglucosaminyl-diphospho-decaprenol L-rhamnosyltransferase
MRAGPINDRAGNIKRGLTSAIIVNFEGGPLLLECLQSLRGQAAPLEVIIVDNGSADGSTDEARRHFPEVRVVRQGHNAGFAGGANAGVAQASGEFLLFLNPDVRLGEGCVQSLVGVMADRRVGVVGPVVCLEASRVLEYGSTIDPLGYPAGLRSSGYPLFVPGCVLMTRQYLFEQLRGFDERMFMFCEDVDYCWRAFLAGSDVRIARQGTASHVGGAVTAGGYLTRGRLETTRFRIVLRERNTLRMLIKCYGWPSAVLAGIAHASLVGVSALVLWVAGRSETARGLIRGLKWNVAHFSETLTLRREVQSTRVRPDQEVRARMYRGLAMFDVVLRRGLPRIDEAWSPLRVHSLGPSRYRQQS